jgi:anti-sigma factor RsiW
MNECQHIGELITGYVDNELTQQQRQRVSVHMERCDSCRSLCEEINAMKDAITKLPYPSVDQQRLNELMEERTSKQLAILGWVGLIVGLSGLFIWHLVVLWGNPSVATALVTLLEASGVLLLASVLRQRLIARKTDRYKDVDL